jgi:hypothetical protein
LLRQLERAAALAGHTFSFDFAERAFTQYWAVVIDRNHAEALRPGALAQPPDNCKSVYLHPSHLWSLFLVSPSPQFS